MKKQALRSMIRKRGKGSLALSTKLGRQHAQVMAKTKVGTGARFASLEEKLGKKPGIKTPGALVAYIGRKKYGKEAFQRMATKARIKS